MLGSIREDGMILLYEAQLEAIVIVNKAVVKSLALKI